MSDVTVKEFESLIEKAYELKRSKEDLEAQAETIGSQLSDLQNQLLEYMEQFEKTSYKSKFGTIIAVTKMSVKTPKDPDSKSKFFAWLDSKGIKDDVLSVNSKTLNSMYNSEMEAAKERGDAEFSIPGIDSPTVYKQIQMRK